MRRASFGTQLFGLALGLTVVATAVPASAYTWSAWNGTDTWGNAGLWSAGVPSGGDSGALIQSGTVTIDSSVMANTNAVLVAWNGPAAAVNMTGGSLAVTGDGGYAGDQSLTVGESGNGTFNQSGGTVTTNWLNINRGFGAVNSSYNLNAGATLNVNTAISSFAGVGNVNLNGGTLNASAVHVVGGLLQFNHAPTSTLVAANTFTVDAGAQLAFSGNADNSVFTTQTINGGGDVIFRGQANGYFGFRAYPAMGADPYTGSLQYTGKTIVDLDPGSEFWQGALWLEEDNVLSHASVLDLQRGKVYLRLSDALGQTVAGLSGNSGTRISADSSAVQKLTLNVSGSYNYGGVIGADPAHGGSNNNIAVIKSGDGVQTLSGANTYAGDTTVTAGTLLVDGSLASAVNVSGGTLGGHGSIAGPVSVDVGGILSPGNSIGTLTISNALTLAGGTLMEINKSGALLTGDLVTGVSTLTYGGALTVLGSGDAFANGDIWNLFDAASFSGSFAAINLPTLGAGLSWNTSNLGIDGTISVVPEPGALALLATGLLGLLAYVWRKRK